MHKHYQCDTIFYPLEWLKLNTRLATSNTGEDMEQMELLYNVGRNSSALKKDLNFFYEIKYTPSLTTQFHS